MADEWLDERMNKRLEQFDAIVNSAKRKFVDKNTHYRDNIHETGIVGNASALVGAAGRLKALIFHQEDLGRSLRGEIREMFYDTLIYAAICIMLLMDENWVGDN